MKARRSRAASQRARSDRLRVRGACHATVRLRGAAPEGAQLLVDYRHGKRSLARECRPLATGIEEVRIKTHPRASHVACSVQHDGRTASIDCAVEIGPRIEPIGKYFIIIGAMKAGTTTLFNLLAQHPAICRTWVEIPGISFHKEINYFQSLYRKRHAPWHYDWRFPFDHATHSWTLDVSPGYSKWPGSKAVSRRIASLPGEFRLAYILREPVDRIESHLAHALHVTGARKSLNHCIRTSRYAMQLDKFTSHVPREKILLLDFEQLCEDPAAVLTQVCEFLSIEPFDGRSNIHNTRSIAFELGQEERAELAAALRADVKRLIARYGFKPAKEWLRKST